MTNWIRFLKLHGPEVTITELLTLASEGPEHPAWNWLYSTIRYLPGDDFPASYEALPVLAVIAESYAPVDRWAPLNIAASIVSFFNRPAGVPDPAAVRPADIEVLRALTAETLTDRDIITGDGNVYYHMLTYLMVFEGVDVRSERLDFLPMPESQIRCPHCQAQNFVRYGDPGLFSTIHWDVYDPDIEKSPLFPVDAESLPRSAKRIHDRAVADGHPDIATMLTHAFGSAHCGSCENLIGVIENAFS